MKAARENYVLLDDQVTGQMLYFTAPERLITARSIDDIIPAFDAIEAALAGGKYIAGYFAYELGLALEPSLQPLLKSPQTLLKLGVFSAPNDAPPADNLYRHKALSIPLKPDWSQSAYTKRFARLKDYITRGHCYQSNLTFALRGHIQASPDGISAEDIFAAFRQNQPGRYGALLKLGGPEIISFSPELFFERQGQSMRMRPMKGTRPRSQMGGAADDARIAQAMRAEPKSQAENLMIVDLLRNDLSRLAVAGSVKVPELFTLETYPTLHQMTSQVTADLQQDLSWLEIFKGLFPCGSVTGAPKIRAMEIIHELESGPRGPYCGAIGYIAPDNSACFNVAIRTAIFDQGKLRYNVGSGVVFDSDGIDEYQECLLKSNMLRQEDEHVFETFRRSADGEFIRLGAHLARLKSACQSLGWDYPNDAIDAALAKAALTDTGQALRIRVQVGRSKSGRSYARLNHMPFIDNSAPLSVAISKYALTPLRQKAEIKTSRRQFYDGERARIKAQVKALGGAVDEVIFLGEDGHICEGSYSSVYAQIDGQLYTPPLSQNILPSILRAELIETGQAHARQLTRDDLSRADQIYCGNSLRGLVPACLISHNKY